MKTKIFFLFILCSSMITGFSQIPTNGLVAWYPFSGNANDLSGNGYNCTVYGATLTIDRFGKPSSAYSFDGINDNISRNSLLNSYDYSTISFWVYSSLDCQAIAPMVADGDGGMSYNGYGVVQNCHATGTAQCPGCGNFLNVMLFGGWWNATNSTATVPLMTWTYLTLTKQHNNWSLYVNAVLVGTGIATPIMPNGSFFIGGNPSGTHCYKGKIDDVRLYNRALSQNEITALFLETNFFMTAFPNNLTSAPEPNCLTLTNGASSAWKWSTGENTKSINVCKSGNYSCNTDTIGTFISKFNDSLYIPNGKVYAIARKGDTVYFGGQFDYLARPTGCGALFNLPRDFNVTNMPRPNGPIQMVMSDGDGGWYLAGDFTKIGLDSVRYIAHIKSDRKFDTAFHLNPNGRVNTIYVAGNRLFVGGSFTKVGDVVRNYLVMVDKATGQANSWNPAANGIVTSVTMFGNNLCVGGTFTNIGGQIRNRLAALDTVNALATAWNPNPDNIVRKLVLNGLKLYVLGDFANIAGQSRARLASFTLTTGNLDTWSPNPNGRVYDLVVSGTNVNYYPGAVYVCGGFSQIGGATRNYLAALDNTNGNVTPWTPVTHDTVMSMAIMENLLFAGGKFVWVNTSGALAGRTGLCSFDLNNTGQVTEWVPNPINTFGKLHSIGTLAAFNNQVYAGGDFFGVKCNSNYKPYIAAINAVTGVALIFNPYTNGLVRTFHINGNYLYVGGDFTEIQNWGTNTMLPRNRIAQVVLGTNGSVTGWNPDANGSVLSIASKGLYIYAGGTFSTIGGNPRPRLSAIKISDGTSSTWTPSPNDTVKCLAVGGDTLYVGGDFTNIAATTRNRIASFSLTGNALNSFDPNANGEVNAIAFKNNKLFTGGTFTSIAGASRNRFASINVITNAITSLDPLSSSSENISVSSLFAADSAIYLSGKFMLQNFNSNLSNPNVCAVKINNSNRSKWWHPDPNGTVRTMFLYQDKMYLGGDFTESLNIYQPYFTCVDNFCTIDNFLPVPADTNFCQGDSVPLWAAQGVGYTYQWYKDNILLAGATKRYYIPIASGWYKALITDNTNYGSLYTNARYVTVDPLPSTTVTASGPIIFCGASGQNVILTAASGTGYSYQWYKNNVIIGGANSINYTATTSGNYYCVVYNASGCPKQSQTVTVDAAGLSPTMSLTGSNPFCQGTTVTLSSNLSAGYFHQWYKNNVKIVGSTAQTLIVSLAGTYKVRDSISTCAGFSNEMALTVNPLPNAAGSITGEDTICPGITTATYSIGAITNATSYIWTLPSGATGSSAINSITVAFGGGFTGGNITVKGHNTCGDGATSSFLVAKGLLPGAAGTINGSDTICPGITTSTYSVAAITNAATYSWTLPSGMTGSSSTRTITVTIGGGFAGGAITVKGHNYCGDGTLASKNVVKGQIPGAAGTIVGLDTICPGITSVAYSVAAISGAVTYIWTLPSGMTGTSSSNSINVTIGAGFAGGNITVKGHSACGDGTQSLKTVVKGQLPSAAGTITGSSVICTGVVSAFYSVPVITGATTYIWTLPAGATGSSLSNSITVGFGGGFNGGSLIVKGHSGCGDGLSSSIDITKGIIPGSAGAISGPTTVFRGSSGIVYQVTPVSGATTYLWTLPTGATGASTSNSIAVSFGQSSVSGNITVKPQSFCGDGPISSLYVIVQLQPPQFAPVTTCASKGAPNNGPVSVPITVTGFDSITSLSLRLDYDPTLLSYTGNSNPNPVLNGLIVNDNHVSATLHKVLMIWTDILPKTLPANSKIVDLNFTHISGTTLLNWNNESNGGADCEYADKNGDPLWDIPSLQFYINGDVHLQQGFKVSGTFNYNNSSVTVLDNIKVYLKLNTVKIDSVLTNASGYYEFPLVQNNLYTLDGATTKPWGGVNGTDALKIQRHFVGLELLTEPVRLQAADVNLSYSINGTDALKVKRRFAGLENSFTRGDWTFAKQITGGDTVIVAGADVTVNFYGLCVGDVNGSNTPSPGKSLLSLINLELNGSIEAAMDKEFELPVKIIQDAQIGAISLVFTYPDEYLTLIDLSIGDKSLSKHVQGNQIRVAWSEIEPMTLNKEEILVQMRFRLNKPLDDGQSLSLSLGNESEIADGWANPIVCTLTAPVITPSKLYGMDDPGASLQNCMVYPNPATEQLTVEFNLMTGSPIQISLIDLTGKQIDLLLSAELPKGNFKRTLKLNALPPGVYTVKINSTGEKSWNYYKKLVIAPK